MATKDGNWFTRLCRNVGLMAHNVKHPTKSKTRVLRKDVKETRDGNLTLRRTTIDEVEIREDENNNV